MEKFAGYGFNKSHAAAYALDRLPDRVLQGAPPGGVHGGEPVARHGRHRQGARALRRRARAGPRDPAAGRQRVELSLRARRREADPLRPRRHQGHRRAGDRGDRRRARGGRRRSATCSTSAAASTSASSTAARSKRWSAPARSTRSSRGARRCSRRSASRSTRRSAPRRRAAQVSLFGEDSGASRGSRSSPTRDWTDAERLAHEKAALGFYLSGHPFAALRRGAGAARAHVASRTSQPRQERVLVAGIVTAMRVQASRRGKMAFVTLDDGQGSVGDHRLQRDVRRRARAAARRPARHRRGQGHAAHQRRRRGAGPAHHRRERLRPRRGAQALREGAAPRLQRQRRRRAPRGDPAAVPQRKLPDRRRVPRTAASAASSSCPTRGASTSTMR